MGDMKIIVCSFVLIANAIKYLNGQTPPVVSITNGRIEGVRKTSRFGDFNAFLGIPYAAPPIGVKRFKPPTRHENWEGVFNASSYGPACLQTQYYLPEEQRYPMSEDCLTLDAYVPGELNDALSNPLHVMVFIHGGGHVVGASLQYTGEYFSTLGSVILVVIQYRLSAVGFMCAAHEEIPGNLGLRDQNFALRWVNRNIENFGGKPEGVTIFGESAGAEAVLFHMVSPMSKGLFHKAIAQSVFGQWRLLNTENQQQDYFYEFTTRIGCEGSLSQRVECFKGTSPEALASEAVAPRCVDGEFLVEQPIDSWQHGRINDAQLIVGFNTGEGVAYVTALEYLLPSFRTYGLNDSLLARQTEAFAVNFVLSENPYEILTTPKPIIVDDEFILNEEELVKLVSAMYPMHSNDYIKNGEVWMELIADSVFISFAVWAAQQYANHGGDVRLFSFEYTMQSYHRTLPPTVVPHGAPHGYELPFLFGNGVAEQLLYYQNLTTTDEEELSLSMIRAWTSFARTGNPVYMTANGEASWPLYDEETGSYLVIDIPMTAESVQSFNDEWQQTIEFWSSLREVAQFSQPIEEESSEEFESGVLQLDSFQADLAVILLCCLTFLLILSTCGALCYICRGQSKDKYRK